MSTDGTHAQRVDEAFSRQATAFEDRHHNHVFTLDAEWLFESLHCGPDDLLLDVAAGTGHASRLLSPRVCSLALADMVADERPEVAGTQNRLERLRDASHARMLPVSEIAALIESLGLQVLSSEAREIDRPLQPWFEHAQASADFMREVRAELEQELQGGAPSGFQPHLVDGELRFCQTWACVTAVKPSA